ATFALDIEARAVYADPRVYAEPEYADDKPAAVRALAEVLDLPAAEIDRRLSSDSHFEYLARGLDIAVGDAVTALELPGVNVLDERRRVYPGNELAANVVGFTQFGDPIVGGGGIESAFDTLLRGTDGERRLEMDPYGRVIPSNDALVEDPVPGWTIRLTLDRDIQWRAQEAIAEAVRTTQADGGTVVVTDPRTGDVLAMADAPTFNPNDVKNADP
nr:penicillin-binding transpeptidase domain-containing protein [Micromonospora sp. DSM 115978]